MFTGIIESTGIITTITQQGTNKEFWIESAISSELKPDQSVSHNGICLTVEEVNHNSHKVTAVLQTLNMTNAGAWNIGDTVNLERCMKADGRFDGHIVQGHVDTTAVLESIEDMNGSFMLTFSLAEKTNMVVQKGSVCVQGISLTVADCSDRAFKVAIIPYTWQLTNLQFLKTGNSVNIEFDIIGKYVERMLQNRA